MEDVRAQEHDVVLLEFLPLFAHEARRAPLERAEVDIDFSLHTGNKGGEVKAHEEKLVRNKRGERVRNTYRDAAQECQPPSPSPLRGQRHPIHHQRTPARIRCTECTSYFQLVATGNI